jgi:hypothetical protein
VDLQIDASQCSPHHQSHLKSCKTHQQSCRILEIIRDNKAHHSLRSLRTKAFYKHLKIWFLNRRKDVRLVDLTIKSELIGKLSLLNQARNLWRRLTLHAHKALSSLSLNIRNQGHKVNAVIAQTAKSQLHCNWADLTLQTSKMYWNSSTKIRFQTTALLINKKSHSIEFRHLARVRARSAE